MVLPRAFFLCVLGPVLALPFPARLAGQAASKPSLPPSTVCCRHDGPIVAVAFSPDGKILASGGGFKDGGVALWEAGTWKALGKFRAHRGGVSSLTFSPDGKILATAGWDHLVRLWDPSTVKELQWFEGHDSGVTCLAFSPDGKTLASGSLDRTVGLWDIGTGKTIAILRGHTRDVCSVAFSPDGKVVASGGVDHTLRLWNAATGQEITQLQGPGNRVTPVAFFPDGKTLLAGSLGGIHFWDVATRKPAYEKETRWFGKAVYEANQFASSAMMFSPDGKTLALVKDQAIGLWEVATGKERCRLGKHLGDVWCLAFSPDGQSVVSGSKETTALAWDLPGLGGGEQLSKADLETLWSYLGGEDASRAYQAIWALAGRAEQTVPFLKKKMPPVVKIDHRRIARLIGDLDHDEFQVREKASIDLAAEGELAAPAMAKALAGKVSVEARRRLEALMEKLDVADLSSPQLLALRGVEVLEQIGPPAREVLEALAKGVPEARLTQEAKAALKRLKQRRATAR